MGGVAINSTATTARIAYKRRVAVREIFPQPTPVNELTDNSIGQNDPVAYPSIAV
jgi:hypothetical protein